MNRLTTTTIAALGLVAGLAGAASAGEVILVPTSGGVGAEMPDIANRITAVIQKVAARHGLAAELSSAPREDVFALAGCTDDTDACHQAVMKNLGARKLILVHVTPGSGGAIADVEIIVATAGKTAVKVGIPLMSETPDALLAELERKAARAFTTGEAPATGPPGGDQPVPDENRDNSGSLDPGEGGAFSGASGAAEPADQPAAGATAGAADDGARHTLEEVPEDEGGGGYDFTRVQGSTWAIAGASAGVFVLGAVFLSAAGGREDDARAARANTAADIEHIRDIESTGKIYNTIGNTGLLLGLAGLGVSGYLIYREAKRPAAPAEKKLSVAPAYFGGDGVGFVARFSR